MTREKFTFYGSWLDAVGHLSGKLRGEVLTAIVEYGLYGETNSARGSVTKAILELVKPQIDRDRNLYGNGCQGGRPRNQTETREEPNQNQTETKPKPNQNQTETKPKPNQNQTETKPKPDETKGEPAPTRARVSHSLNISLNNNINNQDNNLELEKIEREGAGREGKRVRKTAEEKERDLSARSEQFRASVTGGYADLYPERMLEAFISYWTEPNKSRTRLRYELERTWDTGRRLVTWSSRDRTYSPRAAVQPQEDVYALNERLRRESQERIAMKYGTKAQEDTP